MKYKQFHFNSFFGVKGAIYYVVIAKAIFSHVKITCYFDMWGYQVFGRKLTWYFIGVYIVNIDSHCFYLIFILDKIQDGDQDGDRVWWRHSPPAAPPSIKYTSTCREDQRLSTEGKIVSKYWNK